VAVISALRKLRQEDQEFKASLGYIARCCRKTKTNQTYTHTFTLHTGTLSRSLSYHFMAMQKKTVKCNLPLIFKSTKKLRGLIFVLEKIKVYILAWW
jgi:hypothetical protein